MFTTKPESGASATKLIEGVADAKTPVPEIFAPKSPRLNTGKMVPSIIGEDLTITGNVTSKLGDKSQVSGGVVAEDIVVRGHLVGSIKGLRVTLQAPSHVEGDIFHQNLAMEQGAYFEGKSRRSDNPLAEAKAPEATNSKLSRSAESSSSVSSPSGLLPAAAE
jgi:cytoskeletal protein CcmA (bactofilin family)